MRRLSQSTRRLGLLALVVGLCSLGVAASANTDYFNLSSGSFSQNWSNANLITANDDWSLVPSITGYLGDTNSASPTDVDARTWTDGTLGNIDVIANQTNPNTLTNGGVAEFDGIDNPVVALQGSGTADTPGLVIFLNTAGCTGVTFKCNLRDIDGSLDNSVQQIAVQYRVGETGAFTNVPGGYVADASNGPSDATLVTPLSLSMVEWDNQAQLQIRVFTTNARGSDEWIGVDDINVSTVPEPSSLLALGAGLAMLRRKLRR